MGDVETMLDGMKGIKADHQAEKTIWCHIDVNHHISVVIYKIGEEAKIHFEWSKSHRTETVRDYDVHLLDAKGGLLRLKCLSFRVYLAFF